MATPQGKSEKTVRRSLERRQAAGIVLIIVAIVILSIWRAGLATVFPAGWWRIW